MDKPYGKHAQINEKRRRVKTSSIRRLSVSDRTLQLIVVYYYASETSAVEYRKLLIILNVEGPRPTFRMENVDKCGTVHSSYELKPDVKTTLYFVM